jgi:hypothetical protein
LYLAQAVYRKRLLSDLETPMPDVTVASEVLGWFYNTPPRIDSRKSRGRSAANARSRVRNGSSRTRTDR